MAKLRVGRALERKANWCACAAVMGTSNQPVVDAFSRLSFSEGRRDGLGVVAVVTRALAGAGASDHESATALPIAASNAQRARSRVQPPTPSDPEKTSSQRHRRAHECGCSKAPNRERLYWAFRRSGWNKLIAATPDSFRSSHHVYLEDLGMAARSRAGLAQRARRSTLVRAVGGPQPPCRNRESICVGPQKHGSQICNRL